MDIKILKTEKDYLEAVERLEVIFDAEQNSAEWNELELLGLLIRNYEDEHYPIPDPDPIEAIEFIMDQTNLKPKDLVGILGDKSSVSKVLNKKRKLTIEMIRKVHDKLHIPFDTLMTDYELCL